MTGVANPVNTMADFKRYQYKSPPPSKDSLELLCTLIDDNLAEMKKIAAEVKGGAHLLAGADRYQLYRFGCLFYDFYLLVEDCLLKTAKTLDKWIPGSLDWHYRLLRLMKSPFPGIRPPVISALTASLLEDYLVLYLNFHHQCSNLSSRRIEKMAANIDHLISKLEKELSQVTGFLRPRR